MYTFMYIDSFLKESGWERFADAQNCTVYRKQHLSGLYVYKGEGSCFLVHLHVYVHVHTQLRFSLCDEYS